MLVPRSMVPKYLRCRLRLSHFREDDSAVNEARKVRPNWFLAETIATVYASDFVLVSDIDKINYFRCNKVTLISNFFLFVKFVVVCDCFCAGVFARWQPMKFLLCPG